MLEPRRLQLPPTVALPPLEDLFDGLPAADRASVVGGTPSQRREVVHDTGDLDLTRYGGRVSHRAGEGWLVDLPPAPGRPRRTHRLPGGATVPAGLNRLVRALTGGEPLRRLVRLDIESTPWLLVVADAQEPVLVLADEQVSVVDGRRLVARFREVVLRPGTGGSRALVEALTSRLAEVGASPLPDGAPRLLDVLGPRAAAPPRLAEPTWPAQDADLGQVVRASLTRHLRAVVLTDPHVRVGGDDAAIAQLAVALRRLEATLDGWAAHLDVEALAGARAELARAAVAAAGVGERQRVDGRVRAMLRELGAPSAGADVGVDAEPARRALQHVLDGAAYTEALVELRAFVEQLATTPMGAGQPADGPTLVVLRAAWAHLASGPGPALASADTATIGARRAQLDRLADLAEDAVPVLGKPARRTARRARAAAVALETMAEASAIRALAAERAAAAPELAFLAGQLAGVAHVEFTASGATADEALDRLHRRKVTGWLEAPDD